VGDPFTQMLLAALGHPVLLFAAIVAATFVLEDPATVAAALLAADGLVAPGLALAALWFGVAAGDLGLYGLGALGARSRLGRRWVDPVRTEGLRARLRGRTITVLVTARFIPGLRLPTFTAAGAIGLPFGRFVLAVVAATLVWTSLLFGAFYALGRAAEEVLGAWRWAAAAVLVLAVWALERAAVRSRWARAETGHG
jgi:membrane protein DedA with SNARE-associated domain